jgi:hypothetical protein
MEVVDDTAAEDEKMGVDDVLDVLGVDSPF